MLSAVRCVAASSLAQGRHCRAAVSMVGDVRGGGGGWTLLMTFVGFERPLRDRAASKMARAPGHFDTSCPNDPHAASQAPQPAPAGRSVPGLCLVGGGGGQGGFLVRSLVDGAGSYSVAHRAGLLPTELTGMWGWILLRSPREGRGVTPSPRPHEAKAWSVRAHTRAYERVLIVPPPKGGARGHTERPWPEVRGQASAQWQCTENQPQISGCFW